MRLVLLVSGGLGYSLLRQLYKSNHMITGVCTDQKSLDIIEFCKTKAIKYFSGNPRLKKSKSFISTLSCDVLLSINYLFIIEEDLIRVAQKYAINIHGSLLPKYRGRTPHVWAIINGEEKTGITAHIIEKEVDSGDVLKQVVVPIDPEDTGATILKKYHNVYPELCKDVLADIEKETVIFTKQDKRKITYFGKRTPKDGHIDWNWNKERIRNWIRAQAHPYPGAFTYLEGSKVIVNRCVFDDHGYHYDITNGQILDTVENDIIVKTANGAVRLSQIVKGDNVLFKKGQVLK